MIRLKILDVITKWCLRERISILENGMYIVSETKGHEDLLDEMTKDRDILEEALEVIEKRY